MCSGSHRDELSGVTNPGGPIILALPDYVERSLTSILTASSDSAYDTAFDNFFSKELKEITFNGKKLSRAEYQKQLKTAVNAHNTVKFGGIVVALLKNGENDAEQGNVGVFYSASHIFEVIRGDPIDQTTNSSLNILVKEDTSLKGPVFEERRRVFSVDQISFESIPQIHA